MFTSEKFKNFLEVQNKPLSSSDLQAAIIEAGMAFENEILHIEIIGDDFYVMFKDLSLTMLRGIHITKNIIVISVETYGDGMTDHHIALAKHLLYKMLTEKRGNEDESKDRN